MEGGRKKVLQYGPDLQCCNSCVYVNVRIAALSFCFHFVFKLEVSLSAQNSTCESSFYLMGCCPAIGSHWDRMRSSDFSTKLLKIFLFLTLQ